MSGYRPPAKWGADISNSVINESSFIFAPKACSSQIESPPASSNQSSDTSPLYDADLSCNNDKGTLADDTLVAPNNDQLIKDMQAGLKSAQKSQQQVFDRLKRAIIEKAKSGEGPPPLLHLLINSFNDMTRSADDIAELLNLLPSIQPELMKASALHESNQEQSDDTDTSLLMERPDLNSSRDRKMALPIFGGSVSVTSCETLDLERRDPKLNLQIHFPISFGPDAQLEQCTASLFQASAAACDAGVNDWLLIKSKSGQHQFSHQNQNQTCLRKCKPGPTTEFTCLQSYVKDGGSNAAACEYTIQLHFRYIDTSKAMRADCVAGAIHKCDPDKWPIKNMKRALSFHYHQILSLVMMDSKHDRTMIKAELGAHQIPDTISAWIRFMFNGLEQEADVFLALRDNLALYPDGDFTRQLQAINTKVLNTKVLNTKKKHNAQTLAEGVTNNKLGVAEAKRGVAGNKAQFERMEKDITPALQKFKEDEKGGKMSSGVKNKPTQPDYDYDDDSE